MYNYSVQDIEDLKFLELPSEPGDTEAGAEVKSSTVQVVKKKARPVAEKLARKITQPSRFSPALASIGAHHRYSPANRGSRSYDNHGCTSKRVVKDEDCFGNLNEEDFGREFDFEQNLALFDKKMVFEEIEDELSQQNQPDIVRLVDHNRRKNLEDIIKYESHMEREAMEPKYRNDENVLMSRPAQYRPIETGEEFPPGEFVTDAGLAVPALSFELRTRLEKAMERRGVADSQMVELMARSGVELAVQLLGGAHRYLFSSVLISVAN